MAGTVFRRCHAEFFTKTNIKIIVVVKPAILADGGNGLLRALQLPCHLPQTHFRQLLRKRHAEHAVHDAVDLPNGHFHIVSQILNFDIGKILFRKKRIQNRAVISAKALFLGGEEMLRQGFRQPYKFREQKGKQRLDTAEIARLALQKFLLNALQKGKDRRFPRVQKSGALQKIRKKVVCVFFERIALFFLRRANGKPKLKELGIGGREPHFAMVFLRVQDANVSRGNRNRRFMHGHGTMSVDRIVQFKVMVTVQGGT